MNQTAKDLAAAIRLADIRAVGSLLDRAGRRGGLLYGEKDDRALDAAMRSGNEDICLLLISRGHTARREDPQGSTLLGDISWSAAAVRALLAAGADARRRDRHGAGAAYRCAMAGCPEAMRLLVAAGADVDTRNIHAGRRIPAVARAAEYLRADQLDCMAGLGADLRATDAFGDTPLHYAAAPAAVARLHPPASRSDPAAVIRLLIRAGVAVDAVNDRGWTPLYMAAVNGTVPAVAALLEAGADPDVTYADDGRSPAKVIEEGGNAHLQSMLGAWRARCALVSAALPARVVMPRNGGFS